MEEKIVKKKQHVAALLVMIFLLSACSGNPEHTMLPTADHTHETQASVNTEMETTPEIQPEKPQDETVPTIPAHSELYLPDYTTQQIMEYFEEVVLNMEYTDGTGNPHAVQKWLGPIYYRIYGTPTDADIAVLNRLCDQLNAIPGFPGIFLAEEIGQENVSISFLEHGVFYDSFSDVVNGEDAFGAAQFWYYTDTNELYNARIGCRTDLDQITRNSVLVEEVINILGLSDTVLRPDSITYQDSNENTALSDVDLLILTLLYHPQIQCGYNADTCSLVIQQLYY